MFKTVKRIIDWCGEFKGKLYLGFIFSFFSYWFAAMPVMVAAYTIGMLLDAGRGAGTFDRAWIWKSLVIMCKHEIKLSVNVAKAEKIRYIA